MIGSWEGEHQLSETPTFGLLQSARTALEQNALFRGRSKLIQMAMVGNILVLQGELPSYYQKQMLQTILRDVEGIYEIDNRVEVTRS